MEAVDTILKVLKDNKTRREYEESISQLRQIFEQQHQYMADIKLDVTNLREQMISEKQQASTQDDTLPQRVSAMELQVSALISWKATVESSVDHTHAWPPEAHNGENQKLQSAELAIEDPKTVSTDVARTDSNLEAERTLDFNRQYPKTVSTDVAKTDSALEAERTLDFDRQYEFERSVYDLMVLMPLPGISYLNKLFMSLQLLVNLIMVGVTVGILGTDTFTAKPFSNIEAMKYWRYSDGHSATYIDTLTETTLVTRVCAADDTVSVAERQAVMFSDMYDYESDYGSTLANVAVILWVLCCACEIRKALIFAFAMLALPKTKHTEITQDDTGCIAFTGLSCAPRCLVFTLFLLRSVAAIALIAEGTVWLAYTTSITDLLLNASALGFVLDIDNFIFDATGLQGLISLHAALKPIPLPNWKSVAFIPIGIAAGVVGFVVYINLVLIDGVVNEGISEMRAAICQPEDSRQLVFGGNPLRWMLYTTLPEFDSRRPIYGSVAAKVIDSASDATGYAYHVDTLEEIQQSSVSQLESWVQRFPCEDLNTLPQASGSLGQRLWLALGDNKFRDLLTCQDARPYCREEGAVGNNVRFICPVTCGCAFGRLTEKGSEAKISPGNSLLPYMDLLFDQATANHGCPQTGCNTRRDTFFGLHPCEDANASFLLQVGWNATLQRVQSTGLVSNRELSKQDFAALRERGCEGLASWDLRARDAICATTSSTLGFHGIAIACPVSCGCHLKSKSCVEPCPRKCCSSNLQGAGGAGA